MGEILRCSRKETRVEREVTTEGASESSILGSWNVKALAVIAAPAVWNVIRHSSSSNSSTSNGVDCRCPLFLRLFFFSPSPSMTLPLLVSITQRARWPWEEWVARIRTRRITYTYTRMPSRYIEFGLKRSAHARERLREKEGNTTMHVRRASNRILVPCARQPLRLAELYFSCCW